MKEELSFHREQLKAEGDVLRRLYIMERIAQLKKQIAEEA